MEPQIIVALDAMGVIYRPGADVDELVIPFAWERGCAKDDSAIIDLYNDASRGLLDTSGFWERLGVAGDPDLLDREVTARYSITDGLYDYLRWCDDAGIPVACISNDISEWAALRAQLFGLSGSITSWTLSGDVGHRKPDGAIYDAFLASVPSGATCVFVDDRLENVVAAVSRDMRGVLFGASPNGLPPGVESVSDFPSLANLIAGMREAEGA